MPVQISPATLKEWLDQGHSVYLLDVREPWENQFAAIPNSVLVSLGDLSNSLDEVTPPKDAKVVVYCHHGCLLYTSPSPRDRQKSRMPSSA